MISTGPTKLIASQASKERTESNVDRIKQMRDLLFAALFREGYAIQTSYLSEAWPREVGKYVLEC